MTDYSPILKLEKANLKQMDFSPWGGLEGFLRDTSNGAGGYATMNLLKRISPFLSRAISMTAVSISNLPFQILEGDTEVDSSAEWKNKIGCLDNPRLLFYKVAASLCGGRAYLIPTMLGDRPIELHYVAPHTVLPLITTNGLQWFTRASDYGNAGIYAPFFPFPAIKSVDGSTLKTASDVLVSNYNGPLDEGKVRKAIEQANTETKWTGQIMYFWLPDSDIEIGPAKKYPLGTAMISAQMLSGIDQSIKLLADRHFVPATIVSAKGMSSPQDREKMENWFNRFIKGAFETVSKVINADTVSAVKIGGGMEDLKTSYSDITKQAIESIGAAFGIPAGIFTSDKAFAVEMDVLIRIWYSASEFIAIYQCIEDTFNSQLLDRWGYKLRFMPETLDAFQDDEATRATAFRDYASARVRPSIAAQILGIEMPQGMNYKVLDENFDKVLNAPLVNTNRGGDVGAPPEQGNSQKPAEKPLQEPVKAIVLNADEQKEIVLWRQMAQRWFRKGKSPAVDFECKHLPAEIAESIRVKLSEVKSELDIVRAFELEAAMPMPSDGLFALAAAVNKLADKA